MFSLPQPVLRRKAPALVFILALMLAAPLSAIWTAASPAGAQDDSAVPAKPVSCGCPPNRVPGRGSGLGRH